MYAVRNLRPDVVVLIVASSRTLLDDEPDDDFLEPAEEALLDAFVLALPPPEDFLLSLSLLEVFFEPE